MTAFVLVHGAWHGAWCFERLGGELERLGHVARAVDLPCDDPDVGCEGYATTVVDAIADLDGDVVVVGHSLGGLTIPRVAAVRPVRALVFLCALVPVPGSSLVDQMRADDGPLPAGFGAALQRDARGRSFWPQGTAASGMYPDCSEADARWAAARLRPQGQLPSTDPAPRSPLPGVPRVSVVAAEDAAISPAWSRRAARELLGVEPVELPGGHSPFLTRPAELARLLVDVAG
jgi:pimeloyl-ACP methyl ester carboxylesterase